MRLASEFDISGRRVGGEAPCYVIAEAGVSHFGDFQKALKLVDLAIEAKADAVKFQVFDVDEMIAGESEAWKQRLGSRSLDYGAFVKLQSYCDQKGIVFFATAHEEKSLDFLKSIDLPVYKIGSGEVNNVGYLRKIASFGKPVIYSTGMHDLEDVRRGLTAMTAVGNAEIAVLHCVTQYPTPPGEVNLRAMDLLREEFGCITGYSDHTAGYHIPLAAVARGAKILEKHITLDYDIPNAQDWKVSCGPGDLAAFVDEVRAIEAALGKREKSPSPAEEQSIAWARKSLVAVRSIPANTVIQPSMLTEKRPGTGISPHEIEEILGRELAVDVETDAVLRWDMLK